MTILCVICSTGREWCTGANECGRRRTARGDAFVGRRPLLRDAHAAGMGADCDVMIDGDGDDGGAHSIATVLRQPHDDVCGGDTRETLMRRRTTLIRCMREDAATWFRLPYADRRAGRPTKSMMLRTRLYYECEMLRRREAVTRRMMSNIAGDRGRIDVAARHAEIRRAVSRGIRCYGCGSGATTRGALSRGAMETWNDRRVAHDMIAGVRRAFARVIGGG